MRPLDLENAIYNGLRSLDWRRYLCAMWLICEDLAALYADQVTGAEKSATSESLAVVQEAVRQPHPSPEAVSRASRLGPTWESLIGDQDGLVAAQLSPGHWNMRVVFGDLTGEVAGTCRQYEASERVHHAAMMPFWEAMAPPGRSYRPTEIPDDSTFASFLRRLQDDVTEAGQLKIDETIGPVAALRRDRVPWPG